MKRVIYILTFALLTMSFGSCTEEEVAPQVELKNGGGGAIDPMK